ncbi:phosphatase PAP2 family protein [Niabella insulamsoli]|uniref:phosphatase PAP2 family protein n=1 Tax=Niabella insulamsoli TaxID=3144874 RepID=UPI0031FBF0D8
MDIPGYIPLPDWFVNIDRWLFKIINIDLANAPFDSFFPIMRNAFFWGPLYLFIVAFAIVNFKKSGWWWFGLALATAACTDIVGARIFKEGFERLRPCNDPEMFGMVRLVLGRCSGGFSFVSNHAINHFGIAAFVFITFRNFFNYSWLLFAWAAIIGFAQIYVGVHYPFDVLFGAALGILLGTAFGKIFNKKIGFPIFDQQSIII